MNDVLKTVFDANLPMLLIVASLAFLFIAVAGSVAGKIDPGQGGRIGAGVIGAVLLVLGIVLKVSAPGPEPAAAAPLPGNASAEVVASETTGPPEDDPERVEEQRLEEQRRAEAQRALAEQRQALAEQQRREQERAALQAAQIRPPQARASSGTCSTSTGRRGFPWPAPASSCARPARATPSTPPPRALPASSPFRRFRRAPTR
jgi:hypothetical protein